MEQTIGLFKISRQHMNIVPVVGDEGWLVEHENLNSGHVVWDLEPEIPRTNGRVPREHGWLGTTNNRYAYAHGRVAVTAVSAHHVVFTAIE